MPRSFTYLILVLSVGLCSTRLTVEARFQENESISDQPAVIDEVIVAAFKSIHDGWSSDEVILNDKLNKAFVAACHSQLPGADPADLNWRLMNLRKAGKLNVKTTKSNRTSVDAVAHIAEIAARSLHDQHSISTDQIMTRPDRRREFDEIAKSIDPEIDLYQVRKAAFQLRKSRRLRPELITRIADWGRVVTSYSAKQLQEKPTLLPSHPGIYIFRDKTGYLYIGQTENLQNRLKTHFDNSHNQSLASYLGDKIVDGITVEIHSFSPDSRAKETMVRRAYESELIASRQPRFNIQP